MPPPSLAQGNSMSPVVKALLAQLLGLAGAGLGAAWLAPTAIEPPLFALGQGALAATAATLLRSDRWWLPIHLLFAPAIVLALRLALPPAWYLAAFLLLALMYWTSFRTQVPLYLSNRRTMDAVLALLPPDRPAAVIDLGSGSGGLLRRLATSRPDCRFTGIEAAPLPYLWSRLAAREPNLELRRGDFWRESLDRYDLVYAFLSPVPMPRLWYKARAEMRAGALLVSNGFAVPDILPTTVVDIPGSGVTRLYCYRM